MKQKREAYALPSKLDYSKMSKAQRDMSLWFGMHTIKPEFQLYKRTGNGTHMWRCFQLWRRLMPEDIALPVEMLEYFDTCAKGIANQTEPEAIKQALELAKPPGQLAEHGGGASGEAAAGPVRRQRDAMEFIRGELFAALVRNHPNKPPRGYKGKIYEAAHKKFGYSVSHLKRLLSDWPVSRAVAIDFREWQDTKK